MYNMLKVERMEIKSESEGATKPPLNHLCRTCLTEAPDMYDLFTSGLPHVLMKCCDIKVLKNDGLPDQICRLCKQLATSAFDFKTKCELADAKLRSYLTSDQCEIILPVDIKIENDITSDIKLNDGLHKISSSIFCDRINGVNNFREKTLECVLCHSFYDSSKLLIDHVLQTHASLHESERESFFCELCKRKYSREFDLKRHQVTHKNFSKDKKNNVCPFCKEEFPRHNLLVKHMDYHIEDSFFECIECNCFYTSNLHLKKHIKRRHNSNSDKLSNSKLSSVKISEAVPIKIEPELIIEDTVIKSESIENETFESDDFVNDMSNSNDSEYMKSLPNNNFSINNMQNNDSESNTSPSNSKINKLHKISKKKKKLKQIKIKLKNKSISDSILSNETQNSLRLEDTFDKKKIPSERSFLCSTCGKGYYKQNHLDKHLKTHSNEQVKKQILVCTVCGKIVHHSNHLLVHMRTHKDKFGQPLAPQKTDPNKKLILCSMCGKSCSSRSNLAVHMRRHLGVMTSICKICGKGYPRTTDLTLHMRQHTGERPFVCTHCNKGFARSDKLAIHMRIHTGEKPYSCQICGRSFAQSNDLSAHKKRNSCTVHQNTTTTSRSSNITGILSGSNDNQLVYLPQTSALEILPDSSSPKPNSKNSHCQLADNSKSKRNHQKSLGITPAICNSSVSDEEGNLISRTRALAAAAVASNNLLVFSAAASENNPVQMLINPESMASRSMSALVKQNLIVPDILTVHPRIEYPNYNTASLFQNISNVSSAHFDTR